jgi:hypothetical protein
MRRSETRLQFLGCSSPSPQLSLVRKLEWTQQPQ